MRLKRKAEDGFNLSFLDVMACGLGAVILIFILVDFQAFSVDPTEEQNKLKQELAAAQQEQINLQKAIDEINDKIALEASTQEAIKNAESDTDAQQNNALQDISTQLAVVADLDNQLAAMANIPTPDANITLSGRGQQNFIAGMKVEGDQIGILIDKSASMLGDNLLDILGKLALPDGEKISTAKWIRTQGVANWLLSRLPPSAKVTLVVFSDDAKFLGARAINSASLSGSLNTISSDLAKVIPNGGTSLQVGLERLYEANPQVSDIYIVTDGLPTLGDGLPLTCRNFISAKKSISSNCRQALFAETVKRTKGAARVNVILLPIEGDPFASSLYWSWTQASGGTFLSPSAEWP
jgi:hypothetical protein